MTRRTVTMPDGTVLVADALPPGSVLVRVHPAATEPYDKMIVVSPDGEAIFLHGWIGKPLSHRIWRAARDALFPLARFIRWVRLNLKTKTEREGFIDLEPATPKE